MHFPKVNSDVLMFPASFKRSPRFWVFAHRSDPAKSHRDNLDKLLSVLIHALRIITKSETETEIINRKRDLDLLEYR